MKTTKALVTLLLLSLLIISSCKSGTRSAAEETAAGISQQTGSASSTDLPAGSFVKATIDGKAWEATKITPDISAGSDYKRVTGEHGDVSISFQVWKPMAGKKITLTEDHVIDFWAKDGIFGGRKGEISINEAKDGWLEGTFFFTATSQGSTDTHEITNGSFRVPITE
jgi:hypothetical protein